MKNFNRSTLFLSLAFVLCFGIFLQAFPPKTASAAGSTDTAENSGGFIVQADKVEGSMDPVAMAAGNVVMGEGKIYGLTITKKLEKSKPGALIIRIKSQGPIPVVNLKGKLMGLPQFSTPCLPSQLGWLCLNDVKMKLSEQTVGSISLPNATIETCFEGQCADVDPNIQGKDLNQDQGKGQDLSQITKQLDQLTSLLDKTKDLQDVINQGTGALEELIKKAEGALNLPGQLEPLTKQIGDGFKQLQENLNQLAPLLSQSNQLLGLVSKAVTHGDGSQLGKDLEQNLQKVEGETKSLQDAFTALKKQQQGNVQSLNGIKQGMDSLKNSISQKKGKYSADQFQRLLQNLGVQSTLNKVTAVIPSAPSTTGGTTDAGNGQTTGGGTGSGSGSGSGSNPVSDLQQQLTETIQNGKRLSDSIQSTLEDANRKIDDMEKLSGSLVDINLLLGNLLNNEKADQFQSDLDALKTEIGTLAAPVKQLKDTIAKAQDLQNQLGQGSSSDLQDLKASLTQVQAMESRLKNDLKKKLNVLPLLNRIQSFIEQIDDLTKEMDSWDI